MAVGLKYPATALYAVMVYVFIKYGVKRLKLKVIILYIAVSWIAVFCLGIVAYFPAFTNIDGFCDSDSMAPAFFIPLIIMTIIILGCLCVIITFCILTYCYFKKNTLEDNVAVKRAIARNLIYLLIAAIVYVLFYFTPASFNIIREALSDRGILGVIVVEYVIPLFVNFTSIVTPTIVILQPVWIAMKQIFKKNQVLPL